MSAIDVDVPEAKEDAPQHIDIIHVNAGSGVHSLMLWRPVPMSAYVVFLPSLAGFVTVILAVTLQDDRSKSTPRRVSTPLGSW